jgi:hypothetical protein
VSLDTPWERARESRHAQQEKRLGRSLGGLQHPASGRIWRFKRDGKLYDFLIEARTTEKRSYTVSYDEFQAITREAYQTPPGMLPGMQVEIMDLDLMVIRTTDFQAMQQRLMELEDAD